MTRLLCAVAAIAFIVPTSASAQRQHDRNNHASTAQQQHQRRNAKATQRNNKRTNRTNARRQARATHGKTHNYTRAPTRQATRTTTTTTRNIYRIGHRPTTYHRIRARAFVYPRGYRYRRWSIGAVLPRLFLSSTYYWTDWAALGLLPPPPGYVWVRFGPDLLLVNRFTGRVADVIYGAFY